MRLIRFLEILRARWYWRRMRKLVDQELRSERKKGPHSWECRYCHKMQKTETKPTVSRECSNCEAT